MMQNMMFRLLLSFVIFLTLSGVKLFAQPEIGKDRLKEFQTLTQQKVNDLQLYISLIGDKSLPAEQREQAVELAVNLFEKDFADLI